MLKLVYRKKRRSHDCNVAHAVAFSFHFLAVPKPCAEHKVLGYVQYMGALFVDVLTYMNTVITYHGYITLIVMSGTVLMRSTVMLVFMLVAGVRTKHQNSKTKYCYDWYY